MLTKTSDHAGTTKNDRQFYADLWGVKSRAALSRDAWRELRKRCALVLLFAVAALTAYLLVMPAFQQPPDPQQVIEAAPTQARPSAEVD